ncbi:TonB-dependent receptor, partial [Nitrospinae bacterium AH_259_B05_G02_I21]|nr:TonB-dependent receptor [Nitrospinae bacterium AH_259_B05_G02_I21]
MFAFVFTLYLAAVVAFVPLPAAAQSTAGPLQGSETVESQAGAQESSEAPESSGPTGEEAEELGPVVVTATKTAVPLSLSPFSTEVITGQDIEEKQVTSVKEVLRTARGLHVVQTGRGGEVSSIFVRGGESDHNLILLDGIPLNDDGGAYNWSHLTTDNIERIEVIRGAGSALYGSEALTSVIQIITDEGDGPPTLTLSTAYGDQSQIRQAATLKGSRPGVRYSFAASRYDTDGFVESNDFYDNTTVTGKVSFALTDYAKATFTGHYFDTRAGAPNQTGLFIFDPNEFSELDQLAIGLTLTQHLFAWLDHSLSVSVMDRNRFDEDPIKDPPSTARRPEASVTGTTVTDSTSQTTEDLQRRLADYHLNISFTPFTVQTVLTGGVEWEVEDGLEGGASGVTFNDERRSVGTYFQGQLNWRDRIIVVPGVRFEQNQVYGGETVPRVAGAVVLGNPPAESWVGPLKLRGSWGEGIKEPSFFESFDPDSGNPGLAPEQTVHWDSGLELTLCKGRCYFEAVYFHVAQRNKIDFLDDTFINIGKARAEGIEVFGAVEPFEWLRLEGQYTGLETVIKDSASPNSDTAGLGKELLRRPKHSGAGSIIGRWGPLTVRSDVVIVADRFDSDFQSLDIFNGPGYTRVDLAAHFRVE